MLQIYKITKLNAYTLQENVRPVEGGVVNLIPLQIEATVKGLGAGELARKHEVDECPQFVCVVLRGRAREKNYVHAFQARQRLDSQANEERGRIFKMLKIE